MMAQKDSPSNLGVHEHEREILRAALGEWKWERLSCGCPVAMGVYSVEDALASVGRTKDAKKT
jgi:hypothetical protein